MDRPNTVVATLTVRVPLHAAGSLADGAAGIVERIDAVDAVADAAVQRISPGLNDTTVDLRVRVDLAVDDEGADDALARRELEAGVGVLGVDTVEAVETDSPRLERAQPG